MTKQEALKRIKERWDAEGYCDSCGWAPLLSEYGDNDAQLMEAFDIDTKGRACFCCISKDALEPWSHRGVRVYVGPQDDTPRQTSEPS